MEVGEEAPPMPKSVVGVEAYKHMRARTADAQELFDEAVEFGATLWEALRYAERQIRAAMRARAKYLAELENHPPEEEPGPTGPESEADEWDEDEPDAEPSLATRLWS